ncbi:unnamed protein product [marine sediment metagenome]|uniref:Uncharacterized protein n=1 Tax=marine sediment metagenome TaxID=412755 RepID=X1Q968_9ZZZZ
MFKIISLPTYPSKAYPLIEPRNKALKVADFLFICPFLLRRVFLKVSYQPDCLTEDTLRPIITKDKAEN